MDNQSHQETLTFNGFALDPRLIESTNKLGFEQATQVQTETIPHALAHKDLWVSAKTGSGKTAAFLLPALDAVLKTGQPRSGTQILILVPTRELARQIHKQCRHLAEFTPIHSGLITGGEDFKKQSALFHKNAEIIIATPGRLLEHIEEGSPDFTHLTMLILDEADRMLDMGFGAEILKIAANCNSQRQTLMFSATLNPSIKGIALKLLNKPEKVYLDRIQEEHGNIQQQMILADDFEHKQKLLHWLLLNESFDKAIVFTNTKLQADKLRGPIRGKKLHADTLHGDIDQKERNRIMEHYREGAFNILIATDVAARGLDIDGIDLVINFDLARNGDDYVHRIGRTGRGDKAGLAITLINAAEWNHLAGIERYLKQRLSRRIIKELEGKYKGPKKIKASGKAAGNKSKKDAQKAEPKKIKKRLRDQKNIGKRRKPSNNTTSNAASPKNV
ncbi:MAG: DEAD/DEAH box helicase [Gammaproteobacteria bacterium]